MPHIFAFTHEPAYGLAGSNVHKDCLALYKNERDKFVESFVNAGGVSYFCGHEHTYDHSKVEISKDKWFHQLLVGTAGAPLIRYEARYEEENVINIAHIDEYGYLIVEIKGSKVKMEMKARKFANKYKVIETFIYNK